MGNVRLATKDDALQLAQMGALMHAESPRFRHLDFSTTKVMHLIYRLIDARTVIVAERDGALVAMLGFMVAEHFFGHDKTAMDFVVYIRPEHRSGSILLRLVHAFETGAKALGAVEYVLGVSTGISAELVAKAYEKLGYERSGITLIKRAE